MTVALYIRVSTDEQAEQGFSLESQKEKLILYCKSQGWEDYKLYIDDGYTGTNINRPAMKRLLRHIEEKKITSVLVYKLDRLSRKQKDILELIEDHFEKNNVSFNSHQEKIDTSTPFGKAMLGVLAVFAQLDRDMIIERLTAGRRQRVNEGKWYGGRIPFGYSWDKETQQLLVVPEEARIVKEIFNMYLNGHSCLSISEWASARVNNRAMYHNIIRDMIARPVYKGKFHNAGKIVDGIHEEIIDEETWEAAQIESKKRKDGITPLGDFLLTGLLRCGGCGGNIVHVKRYTQNNNKTYFYEFYVCAAQHVRKKDAKTLNCKLGYAHRSNVEKYVTDQIQSIGIYPEKFKEIFLAVTDVNENSNELLLSQLQDQLQKISSNLENLYDAIQNGDIKASAVSDRIRHLEEQREVIENDIDDIIEEIPSKHDEQSAYDLVKQIGEAWEFFSDEEKKMAIRKIIKSVILYGKNGTPQIEWNLY
ncbi:resolvase [Paenibacillus selenitireducens]|uniref:Resolvase n=1 Tax=Paenibacillus selenitireducens TaxID=1324314 RepID=A0A1T2X9R6_9BACL|nr:recombinase family protein [Paenibacillus selenitireducens]OPA76649.1 resolvase [Paenibacillus selenitireducens]